MILDEAEYQKLVKAWNTANKGGPCEKCGVVGCKWYSREEGLYIYGTCQGEALCRFCWEQNGRCCTQCYPGDWGGSIQSI